MKKVNMETNWNTIKETAKELGVKFVGVNKEVIIENINAKIDEMEAQKASEQPEVKKESGKWYNQEGAFPYTEGSLMIITSHKNQAIVGRMVEVAGPSTKRNAVKCWLINEKTGGKQKTCLSLDFDMVTKYIPQYPMVVETTSRVIA